jgi:DNA-binding Xre family transcriptional regulator
MKLKSKIAEIAGKRGFKNAYAIQKALDCSPTMAARLWSGEFKQIGLETLEKLGELLECSPNDLLGYDVAPVAPVADKPKQKSKPFVHPGFTEALAEENSGKPFNHSILELSKTSSDNELLSTVAVAERLNVSRKSVNDYIDAGKLPAVKNVPGRNSTHNFIRESDLLEFIAQRGKE